MKYANTLPILTDSSLSGLQPGQRDDTWACGPDLPSVLTAELASNFYDCDCACAWSPSQQPAKGSAHFHHVRSPGTVSIPLDGGWEAIFNPSGPIGIAVLNQTARAVLAAFETPSLPAQGVNQVPGMPADIARGAIEPLSQAGLLQPVDSDPVPARQSETMSAWLHVTQACNLRCRYCYVHKRSGAMPEHVGYSAADRLVQSALRHGYRTLKLKYAGGEPTLNFPVIEAIHNRATQSVASTGLLLEEVVLSNGVGMTDGMLDWMAREGMRLMVSVDGEGEAHDRVRTRRDGKSAHAAAIDTVERARARGLAPHISITLTSLNLDGIAGAVAFALERTLPFNLNFYRECSPQSLGDAGSTAGGTSPLVPDSAQLTSALSGVLDLIATYPDYPWPLSGILDRTRLDVPHSYPCSAGRDYLAIDPEGRVSACQMLLDHPWSDLAHPDPLSEVREQGQEVFEPVERRSSCRSCAWRAACSGGCPLTQKTALHDRYCEVYQALFPKLVRLEGMRLLAGVL